MSALSQQDVRSLVLEVTGRLLDRGAPTVYDSKGFSKVDYNFARDVHWHYRRSGNATPRQLAALQKMLYKYRKQIDDMGYDVSFLKKVIEIPKVEKLRNPTARVEDERIFIDIGKFDAEILFKLKQIPERTYHPESKTWSFPIQHIEVAYRIWPHQCLLDLRTRTAVQEFRVVTQRTAEMIALEDQIRANWSGLYEHQVEGIAHILPRDHSLLADDMGPRKTRQSIIPAIIRGGQKLVICPATLKDNWKKEIKMVDPDATIQVIGGSIGPNPESDWNIVNYDVLKKWRPRLMEMGFVTEIIDEAHRIKNEGAGRSKQVLGWTGGSGKSKVKNLGLKDIAEHVVLLTGTPIMSRPMEIFNLLKAVGHPLGKNWWQFAQRYCGARQDTVYVKGGHGSTKTVWNFKGASNLEELAALISDIYLQRKKDECLDLPGKFRFPQYVQIDLKKYQEYEDSINWKNHLAKLTLMRVETADQCVPATISRLEDIIDAEIENAVVFSCFTDPIDRIANYLNKEKPTAVVLDGRTSKKHKEGKKPRECMCVECTKQVFWEEPNVRVLVGQIQAAGQGHNLQNASQVIFNDFDWVPANHDQAEDRCYRIGQDRKVTVTFIVAEDTMAEDLQEVYYEKKAIVSTVENYLAEQAMKRREARKKVRRPTTIPSSDISADV